MRGYDTGVITAHAIEYHARMRPGHPAMVFPGIAIGYARLHDDLRRMLGFLRGLGCGPGQRVAVCHPDAYTHWLMLLACEALGAATLSFQDREFGHDSGAFEGFHWVLSPPIELALPAGVRHKVLHSPALVALLQADAGGLPPLECAPSASDAVVRVIRTSGSTGEPKRMGLTRHQFEGWLSNQWSRGATRRDTVDLIALPPAVQVAFAWVHACLRQGATVAFGTLAEIAVHHEISRAGMLPLALGEALEALPPGRGRPWIDRASVVGGALAPAVRERALQTLCAELVCNYGTNEAGSVGLELDDEGQGVLSPGVQAWVCDEQGQPVAPGEEGVLWVRTPETVDGYWGAPQELAYRFVDGAFRTGDRARLYAPRRLQVLGRMDDVLNIGGLKKSPRVIENEFLAHPAVREVAVLMADDAQGRPRLAVVLVRSDATALVEIARSVARRLPSWARGMAVYSAQQLPRSPGGKVDRVALARWLASRG